MLYRIITRGSWSISDLRMRLVHRKTGLSPPVKYFYWPFQGCASFVDYFCYFCLVLLCFHVRLFVDALWSPAGKGLTSRLSFVMSYCDVFTFPLSSLVRYGDWLNRFLIFALFLTSYGLLISENSMFAMQYVLPRLKCEMSIMTFLLKFNCFGLLSYFMYNSWLSCKPHWIIDQLVLENKSLKVFNHMWALRPFWSCDQNDLYKSWLTNHKKSSYEIWVHLAKWFLR